MPSKHGIQVRFLAGAGGRVEGLDLARGLAVFGMAAVNYKYILGFEGEETGALGSLAAACDGRAAATFVTLAGIGVALMARRALAGKDGPGLAECRKRLYKRAAFLLVLGFLDSFLWPGDILHFYAIYLALAAALLDASDRVLLGSAAASAAAFVAMFLFLDYGAGWDLDEASPAGMWVPRRLAQRLFFNGFHPVFPWLGFLLVGIWLGRRDLGDGRLRRYLVAGGVAAALAAESASPALMAWAAEDAGGEAEWCALLFGTQSMPPGPLYLVSGGGSALAAIGLCLICAQRFSDWAPVRLLGDAGRMALTLFVAHVLYGVLALDAAALGGGKTLGSALAGACAFYGLALLFVSQWRRRFEHGPLEALMRRLAG